MKQTTVNEFKDGLNLDLHPLVTPKTVLTDNINGTFITYNGNEFCLQNDRGNKYTTSLTPGYTPIGIKEHNGILYIVSVNGNGTEIGTFPSPNYPDSALEYDYDAETVYDLNLNSYAPLHVLEGRRELTGINLGYSTKTPVTIEIQDSYDGSVNLILVADGCIPRIINSGFSVLPDNKYKFINRRQSVDTNIYDDVYKESELIRTSEELTNIDLLGVKQGGQFKGGNYTFYIKFGDADFNQTDVVAESGIVSVFNGNNAVPSTISGTLLDERTDKMIGLGIMGLNPIYSKIYIYYSREYSDTQGYRMTEYGMFKEPIDLDENSTYRGYVQTIDPATNKPVYTQTGIRGQEIWLTGFEQTVPIDPEILNIGYHTIDWARAETQHSNMLFLGNVGQKETFELYEELDNITKQVTVDVAQTSLTAVSTFYNDGSEYYDVHNIYNRVGYYPGEIYRFGIVYILKDGSKTPVFNMNGKNFQNGQTLSDGVFLMPDVDVIYNDVVKPIYLTFTLPNVINDKVSGWFVVRQKRIPNTICEGLNIAIDKTSNTPVIWDGQNWITQSFLDAFREEYTENYENDVRAWQEKKDVQLKYDNCNLSHSVFTESEFQSWVNENNLSYANNYWVVAESTNTRYSINTDIPDTGNVESKLEFATRNLADQHKAAHEEAANWNYIKVFTVFTDTEEQVQTAETILNNIENGTSYGLIWLRQYTYEGSDEANIPIDTPTDNYAVALVVPGAPIDYEQDVVTNDDHYNTTLRNNWKSVFSSEIGTSDGMLRKRLKEWKCIDYWKEANALLSLDPCVNQTVASILDGSNFEVRLEREVNIDSNNQYVLYREEVSNTDTSFNLNNVKCVFVPSNTGAKVVDGYEFSNVAGSGTAVDRFKYFTFPDGVFERDGDFDRGQHFERLKEEINNPDVSTLTSEQEEWLYQLYRTNLNINLIRGLFTPYIGLANKDRIPNGIYSIKHKASLNSDDFIVRQQDQSEYYAVSNYLSLNEKQVNVFRGDCFTNTITMRIIRPFIDSTAPVSDVIVDPDGWAKWVINKDINSVNLDAAWDDRTGPVRYDQVNLSDVNTVDLGLWVTFKCLSSYNLGLRSLDTLHVDEMSLMGAPRTFHPLNAASTATGYKMEESFLLNDGLSATVGRKRYNAFPKEIPYSKSEFANRIMFSNIHITDNFTNGYRTFQGLSYKDYDKQYGAITKLIPLGQNIFVVMEHGLGLVSVNPKALMQTTTGEAIHIYGYGVLPNEMTIISQDYGSKYEHSVIRTPIGIYGMDVDAKKIWRFSDKQGFETISDMKIETYLNDHFHQIPVDIGIKDVRAHYNGKKGDVMFTFYDESDSIKHVKETEYFNISNRRFTIIVNESKNVVCETNLKDDDVEFTNSDNLECSYSNKILHIEGLQEGTGEININEIPLIVDVVPKAETSLDNAAYINVVDYPDDSWYVPNTSQENKGLYFDIRQIDTFYGMRFSLPIFLKCPNGRPTSSDFSAVYSIDRQEMVSVESENKSIIDVPKNNHFASTALYNQCDGYTLPTIVHVTEKCFKNTGTVGIRIYNKDKTEYDTCIVNVLNTNPEGTNVSQFEQKNLIWPFNIYVNKNSCFDIWTHHHLRGNQVVTIDDPTAVWQLENGYVIQDGVKTEGVNIKLLYSSRQFKTGYKSGTYHITFTCTKTQYYDYSGSYTVTVHII